MSIYGSTLSFDQEDHDERCERWQQVADGEDPDVRMWTADDREYAWHPERPCTCGGDARGAIAYRGSHLYPDPEPPNRTAEFDLGVIPGHIAEGGGYDDAHEHWAIACHRPFLRVAFFDPFGNDYPDNHAVPTRGTVVLDAGQVEELRDALTDFLERISGDWCLKAEPPEQRDRGFAAFLDEQRERA